jgi:hypothetical protein
MRLAAWNLINGQLRPTFLRGDSRRMRGRPSMTEVNGTLAQWRRLARWLEEGASAASPAATPASLTTTVSISATPGRAGKRVLVSLVALTRLCALDQLSARPNGIACPPWEDLGLDDYLPAATSAGGGENATEPIAEQTIGPLLTWAMRLVGDLSGDILAGWAERQRLIEAARANAPTPAGLAALETYLRP